MRKTRYSFGVSSLLVTLGLALLVVVPFAAQGSRDIGPHFSEWSAVGPVGPPINDAMIDDACPFIAKNGLDLYFRKWIDGRGYDIFVSHRDTAEDPWEEPISLPIDTTRGEICSFVTIDGHWLYFVSNRLGGYGSTDLYVSHRKDKRDDLGWETPINLGPSINTAAGENGPCIFEDEESGRVTLYFTSNNSGKAKIYSCEMLDKETPGPASLVADLNSLEYNDLHAFVRRKDGLEVIFASDRESATVGMYDLFVSTRASLRDPWSPPEKLGPDVNSEFAEARPSISWDGTTLYFWTNRNTNTNGNHQMDVYQATRTQITGKDKQK